MLYEIAVCATKVIVMYATRDIVQTRPGKRVKAVSRESIPQGI